MAKLAPIPPHLTKKGSIYRFVIVKRKSLTFNLGQHMLTMRASEFLSNGIVRRRRKGGREDLKVLEKEIDIPNFIFIPSWIVANNLL